LQQKLTPACHENDKATARVLSACVSIDRGAALSRRSCDVLDWWQRDLVRQHCVRRSPVVRAVTPAGTAV